MLPSLRLKLHFLLERISSQCNKKRSFRQTQRQHPQ